MRTSWVKKVKQCLIEFKSIQSCHILIRDAYYSTSLRKNQTESALFARRRQNQMPNPVPMTRTAPIPPTMPHDTSDPNAENARDPDLSFSVADSFGQSTQLKLCEVVEWQPASYHVPPAEQPRLHVAFWHTFHSSMSLSFVHEPLE